jgi:hypothetical protein
MNLPHSNKWTQQQSKQNKKKLQSTYRDCRDTNDPNTALSSTQEYEIAKNSKVDGKRETNA